jgi:adenine-specific DNA-methyltransferase
MSKYSEYSQEQLVKLLDDLNKKLNDKRLGLVWDSESDPELMVQQLSNNLPILTCQNDMEILTDLTDDNILIEGDNIHALNVLNYTHKEKIDVIYIDPPYNTGNKDWKYNDSFVDKNNGFRHSKWLNMMQKRLEVSRNLLKDSGVIFISIDDNEIANLRLLMNKIYDESNFIAQITREAIKGGSKSANIREVHDYVLIYAKDKNNVSFSGYIKEGIKLDLLDDKGEYAKGRELNKWGAGSRREDAPSMWFPISGPNGEEVYPIRNDGSEGRWRLGKRNMIKKVSNNDVLFEKREDGTFIVYEKIRDNPDKIKQFTTLFRDNYLNAQGTKLLKKIFGTTRAVFDYAKPIELIYDLLIMANCDDDALILDFFAGSGTTGHAVMKLNNDDGGNRKFILCNNNEGNIFTDVLYPRISKVTVGYDFKGEERTVLYEKHLNLRSLLKNAEKITKEIDEIEKNEAEKYYKIRREFKANTVKLIGVNIIDGFMEGLKGNVSVYKTETVHIQNINSIDDDKKLEITRKVGSMIALKESTNLELEINTYYQIFTSRDKRRQSAIYFSEDLSRLDELIIKLHNIETKLYLFSYGKIDSSYLDIEADNITIEDIPEPLLAIYRELNSQK